MISMESFCTFTLDKLFIFKRSIILAFRRVKNHSDLLQDHTTEGQLVHCLFMTSLGNIISFESPQVTYEKCLCYVWRFAVNMCETGIQVLGIAWLYASAFIVVPCDCILWDKGSDLLDTILAGSISLESFVRIFIRKAFVFLLLLLILVPHMKIIPFSEIPTESGTQDTLSLLMFKKKNWFNAISIW